jgi:hypothetical protein
MTPSISSAFGRAGRYVGKFDHKSKARVAPDHHTVRTRSLERNRFPV